METFSIHSFASSHAARAARLGTARLGPLSPGICLSFVWRGGARKCPHLAAGPGRALLTIQSAAAPGLRPRHIYECALCIGKVFVRFPVSASGIIIYFLLIGECRSTGCRRHHPLVYARCIQVVCARVRARVRQVHKALLAQDSSRGRCIVRSESS